MADDSQLTSEQEIALQNFVGLTEIMSKRQAQVEELGKQRRAAARVLRELDVSVPVMAKAAGVGPQTVYKLLAS